MLSPNLSTLGTKIKWIALFIMEDDGCSLTFEKMANTNIIKLVAKLLTYQLKAIIPPSQIIGKEANRIALIYVWSMRLKSV